MIFVIVNSKTDVSRAFVIVSKATSDI